MRRRRPSSTRPDTLLPVTTLFRSVQRDHPRDRAGLARDRHRQRDIGDIERFGDRIADLMIAILHPDDVDVAAAVDAALRGTRDHAAIYREPKPPALMVDRLERTRHSAERRGRRELVSEGRTWSVWM